MRFSITAGANFGLMDKYAISEYSSFSSIEIDDTITGWTFNNQRTVFKTNPFFFVRGQGKIPDKIYTNPDDAGYNLILEDFRDTEEAHYKSLTFPE